MSPESGNGWSQRVSEVDYRLTKIDGPLDEGKHGNVIVGTVL